jgi:PPOX class probable F420-dependent enzyme
MRLMAEDARRRVAGADHGVLGTLRGGTGIDLVPVCFAIDGDVVAMPIERVKPKAEGVLQRLRNLEADPRATLLCERWDPVDWSRLWWVRLRLQRSVEEPDVTERLAHLLRQKYPQYVAEPFEALVTFRIAAVAGWSAA